MCQEEPSKSQNCKAIPRSRLKGRTSRRARPRGMLGGALAFCHGFPAGKAVTIIKKKSDKADNHGDIFGILQAGKDPKYDQNDVI